MALLPQNIISPLQGNLGSGLFGKVLCLINGIAQIQWFTGAKPTFVFSSEDWKATVDALKTDLNCGRLMKRLQIFCRSFRLREESRRATRATWTWFSGLQGPYSSWPFCQPWLESAGDTEDVPSDSWVCGGPIHAGTSNPTYGLNG